MAKGRRKKKDILVYTHAEPLINSEGKRYISIEAIVPGDLIVIKSHGYIGLLPKGSYAVLVLYKGKKESWPYSSITIMSCYNMKVLCNFEAGGPIMDEFGVIEGTLYELLSD